jgi:peptidoglycan DL-endopeptidase RipA
MSAACALVLVVAGSPTVGAAPTPTAPVAAAPGVWASVTPAQQSSDDAAVTALVAKLAAGQATLTAASQAAEQAEQRAALANQQLLAAQDAETRATAAAVVAGSELDSAETTLRTIAVDDYMGGTSNSMSILLAATDPTRLLETEAVHSQLAATKALAMTQAAESKKALDLADAAALAATSQSQNAAAIATQAETDAMAQQVTAQNLTTSLSTALAQAQLTQQQDASVLAALSGGYGGQPLTPAQLGAYAQQAVQAAAQPLVPAIRHWTAAEGQSAAYRALSELTVAYSFAAGNAAGATMGVNSAGGGEHDGSIRGFDCSGLSLYAWAPYLSLAHDAAAQYAAAGHLHPTPDQLLPGDLIFWSSDATATGIHHVAIYIGAGLVVQAPQSGDVVRVTAMNAVAPGIFGATRPLT